MDTADRDYASVENLRRERRLAVRSAEKGDVSGVLGSPGDAAASRVYVVKLLDVHPALGKVKGRRLLAGLGVGPFARVMDLKPDQVSGILLACGENR